jgi:hypothetical protein
MVGVVKMATTEKKEEKMLGKIRQDHTRQHKTRMDHIQGHDNYMNNPNITQNNTPTPQPQHHFNTTKDYTTTNSKPTTTQTQSQHKRDATFFHFLHRRTMLHLSSLPRFVMHLMSSKPTTPND